MAVVKSNVPVLDADEILDGVLDWVGLETPSHDAAAVNRLVDRVENSHAQLEAHIERTPGREGFGDILKTRTPCSIRITGGINRPPYEKFEGIEQLFQHAKKLAAEIGFELDDLKTGGGSDGNFTGTLGIPTLDGLGADGHGAHSYEEHIYYSSLVERTQLLIRLFETLD